MFYWKSWHPQLSTRVLYTMTLSNKKILIHKSMCTVAYSYTVSTTVFIQNLRLSSSSSNPNSICNFLLKNITHCTVNKKTFLGICLLIMLMIKSGFFCKLKFKHLLYNIFLHSDRSLLGKHMQ